LAEIALREKYYNSIRFSAANRLHGAVITRNLCRDRAQQVPIFFYEVQPDGSNANRGAETQWKRYICMDMLV
jgi:hypothetical protein